VLTPRYSNPSTAFVGVQKQLHSARLPKRQQLDPERPAKAGCALKLVANSPLLSVRDVVVYVPVEMKGSIRTAGLILSVARKGDGVGRMRVRIIL
jgi:hypothetical protein